MGLVGMGCCLSACLRPTKHAGGGDAPLCLMLMMMVIVMTLMLVMTIKVGDTDGDSVQ